MDLKNDLEFIRTGLKTVVTAVSPRSQKQVAVSVRGIYDRLRDRYVCSTEEKRISWIVSSPPETVRVIADEPAIERRVFGNLVENALRHTLYGRTVEVGYRIEDKTFVGFVRDTGPGISKDDLPKLFSPGTQLDPNTKGLAGLGLASVKSVIETHNGRVWVESVLGKGSTFYFSLPIVQISN